MAGKKTRRSQKKGPKTPSQLPLDIIYNIGLQLTLDPNQRLDTLHGPVWLPTSHNKDLRTLTYISKATKDLLEPLLYRHVVLMKPQQVCSFFVTIAAAPRLREYVQHFGCVARFNGPQVRKVALPECRAFWQKHHGSHKVSILNVLTALGLPTLVWAASLWERKKDRFVFNADFRHDAVLELLFVSTLFLLKNVQTFVWKDLDARPIAPLLGFLLDAGLTTDLPLMPKLKVLNTWKETRTLDERAQFFIHKTHLWENLHTLYLNSVDLDNEFIDMIIKGDFKKELPVKKLYIHCQPGAQHLNHPGMYNRRQRIASESALDAENPDNDKDKFKAFRNLDYLDILFTWYMPRAQEGSPALKALLHAVGAPERLILVGHPLPMKALSTGVVHSRLKYLKVTEFIGHSPSSVQSKDALIAKLNQLWDAKDWKRLVPNLCEIDWDHYKFRRKDLEGEEDKAVWTLEDEEEWEDEDEDDYLDHGDIFGYGFDLGDGFGGFDAFGSLDDDDDDGDVTGDGVNPLAILEALHDGQDWEEFVHELAQHFPPGGFD
ncbi:hypothetical protein N0V84_004257 [Fusarium piperis]|uniref:Uncharacterized protein n=1 Tax=Fusarium piperis TaxID=1435070 RepID=A0A9W8WG81_9HYPO|nr:hypothetical protein N0V84_004257 [Fusarium piperis]